MDNVERPPLWYSREDFEKAKGVSARLDHRELQRAAMRGAKAALWAKCSLLLCGGWNLAGLMPRFLERNLANRAWQGQDLQSSDLSKLEVMRNLWNAGIVVLSIATAVAMVAWTWYIASYSERVNLATREEGVRPWTAVLAWFCPIASPMWPGVILNNVSKTSHPVSLGKSWRNAPSDLSVVMWLLTLTVSVVGSRIVESQKAQVSLGSARLVELADGALWVSVGLVLAALFGFLMVGSITRRQREQVRVVMDLAGVVEPLGQVEASTTVGGSLSPEQKGAAGLSILAAAMLAYAVFGNPPHSYFMVMRWSVGAVCGYWAAIVWQKSKALAPVALGIAALGMVHVIGDMRRAEWEPVNLVTGLTLLTLAGAHIWPSLSRTWRAVVAFAFVALVAGGAVAVVARSGGARWIWFWDDRFWGAQATVPATSPSLSDAPPVSASTLTPTGAPDVSEARREDPVAATERLQQMKANLEDGGLPPVQDNLEIPDNLKADGVEALVMYQARVYAEPSREATILVRLHEGTTIFVTSYSDGGTWREVIMPDGGRGYILAKQVSAFAGPLERQAERGTTTPIGKAPRFLVRGDIAGQVYADTGSGHWIDDVTGDAKYIKLEDGSLWEVSPVDTIDSGLWLHVDDIVVIDGDDVAYPYRLINKDQGERVDARLLKH